MKIEIARSFDQKVQIKEYEPVSFFCSMKAECDETEAEEVGRDLLLKCVAQVERDLREYQERHAPTRRIPEIYHSRPQTNNDEL